MTDALLPAAPQPLEKESDDYFRKVSRESANSLCPCKLQRALKGLATGVGLGRRGRGKKREGTRRVGAGRTAEKGVLKGDCAGLGTRSRWQPGWGAQVHRRATRRWEPGEVIRMALPAFSRWWGKDQPLATLANSVGPFALIPQPSFHRST